MDTAQIKEKLIHLLGLLTRGDEIAGPDGLDEADLAEFQICLETQLANKERTSKLIRDIKDAIKRIDRGTYGVCEISGERIPQERLDYFPWARYTASVQSQIDAGTVKPRQFTFADLKDDPAEDEEPGDE